MVEITDINKKKRQSVRMGKKIIPLPPPVKKPTIISDTPFKVFFGFKPQEEEP